MNVTMIGESLLGSRDEQQDAYLYRVKEDVSIAVVCDGMGGLSGGAVASQLAVKTFKEDVLSHWPIKDIPAFLNEEALKLDKLVYYLQDGDGEWLHAGTTMIAILVVSDRMYFLGVGDSRLFLQRGQGMISVTREHNYKLQLEEYRKSGVITEQEYISAVKERGEALVSYLGYGNISVMDISQSPITLQQGDRILLCSDGLTKAFSEQELKEVFIRNKDIRHIDTTIRSMLQRKQQDNQDNTTYIIVEFT